MPPNERWIIHSETGRRVSAGRSTDRPPSGLSEPARVDGTLVETTWSHPFYIEGKGWVKAEKLRAGDVSKTDKGTLRIAKVHVDPRSEEVYNFEVAENHTYLVTDQGVVVHNAEDYLAADYQRGLHSLLDPKKPFPYILMKNGQVLDVSHVTDTERTTNEVIKQMELCLKLPGDTCRITAAATMPQRGVVSTTEVEISKEALGIKNGDGIESEAFRNAARGIVLTHNYLNEHRESMARIIDKAGTVYREEDLPSASVGIEIELTRRQHGLSEAQIAQAEAITLKSMGGANYKIESKEFETENKSYEYAAVGLGTRDNFRPDAKSMYTSAQQHQSALKGIKVTKGQTNFVGIDIYPFVQHNVEGGDEDIPGGDHRRYRLDEEKGRLVEIPACYAP